MACDWACDSFGWLSSITDRLHLPPRVHHLKAIVCSPLEIASIRSAVGPDIEIITPGVRPQSDSKSDDQKRTMTPIDAMAAGASLLVIGRPITSAWREGAAAMSARARSIADEILK